MKDERVVGENASAQALIHFYRGELSRSDNWRTRLDTTTNWAVGTTAALLSVAFSGHDVPTVVFPFAASLLLWFLSMEARKYRYYEVSIARVRAMEQAFFSPMLSQGKTDEKTLTALAKELDQPEIRVSHLNAIAVRLWRAYAWLFVVVYLAWIAKVWMMPYELTSFGQALQRLKAGPIPGSAMLAIGVSFLVWLAWASARGYRLTHREGGRIRKTPLAPKE